MKNYQILKRILHGSEVTMTKDTAIINKYYKYGAYSEEFDFFFAMMLIQLEIIELDCGNWETGEQHYRLNEKYFKYDEKTKIKHILIKKIDNDINDYKVNIPNYKKFPTFLGVSEALEKIKKNLTRKNKLLKLKDI